MKRLLLIAAMAVLGATVYVADPPRLPATETPEAGAAAPTPAAQSEVVRLAEASLALRRQGEQGTVVGGQYDGPWPARIFRNK